MNRIGTGLEVETSGYHLSASLHSIIIIEPYPGLGPSPVFRTIDGSKMRECQLLQQYM